MEKKLKVKCLQCNDIIDKPRKDWFTSCNCGKTSVDFDQYSTKHHRILYPLGGCLIFNYIKNKWENLKQFSNEYPERGYKDGFNWDNYGS